MKTFFKKICIKIYLKYKFLKNYFYFIKNFYIFKKLSKNVKSKALWKNRMPQLNDKTTKTSFDRHYIYHPAWAARILAKTKPDKHIDISSTLYFCSMLSAFIPTEFYDYRPANLNLTNLKSNSVDLLKLPFKNNSVNSLSCMHTIEHIG
jgi:hypothetical protein